VCSWKNCRAFQKAYREYGHPVLDGVIKMKFIRGDTMSQPLKNSIDRTLKVSKDKRLDWKPGKRGEEAITYKIARHHFTEQHILRYLNDAKSYKWTKLFTTAEAKKYLFKLEPKESVRRSDADADLNYFQCPNVSKEYVKNQFLRMKQGDAYDEEDEDNKSQLGAFFREQRHSDDTSKGGVGSYGNGIDPATDKDTLTVSTSRSADLLAEKERENERLRKELEACQSQLTYLHEMVRQLQEDTCDNYSRRSSRSATSGRRGGPVNRRSHNVFPEEVCYDNENDEDVTYGGRGEGVDWSDEDEEETIGDESTIPANIPPGKGIGVGGGGGGAGGAGGSGSGSGGASGSAKRRTSVASRASIVSASQSIKSLPREIELAEDMAKNRGSDSDDTSMEDAFDDRSYVSSHSRTSGKYDDYGHNKNRNRNRRRDKNRQNRGGNRYSSHDRGGGSGGYDDIETYEVQKQVIVDPYGEKGTYAGSLSKATGMPHGEGRLEYAAGRWYEGDWKHGRWTGHGRLSNGDGDLYEGELRNDHKHGKGTMRFADGRVFVGEYINGQMIEGMMTYQDGSTYEGSWVDGMRHGRGKCVFTDKSVYEGDFREGEFHGYGKMAWSDGGWYEGEWWNGDMQGQGKEVRPDGSLRHEGQWSKGQPIRNRK